MSQIPLDVSFSFPDQDIDKVLEDADDAAFLDLVFKLANFAANNPEFRGKKNRLAQLDAAVLRRALRVSQSQPGLTGRTANPELVIIATEVYPTGGHTRVINSIVQSFASHVVLTDTFGHIAAGALSIAGLISDSSRSVTVLPAGSLPTKTAQLIYILETLSPSAVVLVGHHSDVLSIVAGACFEGGQRTVFLHHCDYNPGLGATLNFPVHFDFTQEMVDSCASIGLQTRRLPLVIDKRHPRVSAPNSPFRVVTAGGGVKYRGMVNNVTYADLVTGLLKSPLVSELHHVGDLVDSDLELIFTTLAQNGIDSLRFRPLGLVPDLEQAFADGGYGLCLSSFPYGGGLTTSTAASLGLPVIFANQDLFGMEVCRPWSVYPNADLAWAAPSDLPAIVERVTGNWIGFSDEAFRHYCENSTPEAFEKVFRSALATLG